jgi:hypothetical protein
VAEHEKKRRPARKTNAVEAEDFRLLLPTAKEEEA